jgi:YVTN family beta-propeller protein
VVATIDLGHAPAGVAATPDGAYVYVSALFEGQTVSVIDTATNQVVKTMPVGNNLPVGNGISFGVAVTPDGAYVYVAMDRVWVIETATNQVVASVLEDPSGLAVTPDGTHVYVATGQLSVIDTATEVARFDGQG